MSTTEDNNKEKKHWSDRFKDQPIIKTIGFLMWVAGGIVIVISILLLFKGKGDISENIEQGKEAVCNTKKCELQFTLNGKVVEDDFTFDATVIKSNGKDEPLKNVCEEDEKTCIEVCENDQYVIVKIDLDTLYTKHFNVSELQDGIPFMVKLDRK